MRIWRAGCIIQSGRPSLLFPANVETHLEFLFPIERSLIETQDAICEFLLPLFEPFSPSKPLNLLSDTPEIAKELKRTYEPIKEVYKLAIETDSVAPAVGATLEWLKAVGGKNLPTDFEEMELDCE